MKPKGSCWAGVITVFVVTTACILLVASMDGFDSLANEQKCNLNLVCHLHSWRQLPLQRTTNTALPVPPPAISSIDAKSQFKQLSKRDTNKIPMKTNPVTINHETLPGDREVEEVVQNEHAQEVTDLQEIVAEDGVTLEGLTHQSMEDYGLSRKEIESFFTCFVNSDCGLGYGCFEGRCKPGCSKHQDCPRGYECQYGRWGYRCFEKKGWHRECRVHLRLCSRHHQCCSGYCGRGAKGKVLMCRPVV